MTLDAPWVRLFQRTDLLEQALTHKSFHNENTDSSRGHNERLEFLGDAVVDLVLSDLLMRHWPDMDEGELSKARAGLVNENALAEIARGLKMDQVLRLGRGELASGGAGKPRLLASVFEAVIGALYLDAGFSVANQWLGELFTEKVRALHQDRLQDDDFKTRLQELTQAKHRQTPQYTVIKEEGPDHNKLFTVVVKVGGQVLAQGEGRSKKHAEQEAAKLALEVMK